MEINPNYLNSYEKEKIKELEDKIRESNSVHQVELYQEQIGLIVMKAINRIHENNQKLDKEK